MLLIVNLPTHTLATIFFVDRRFAVNTNDLSDIHIWKSHLLMQDGFFVIILVNSFISDFMLHQMLFIF